MNAATFSHLIGTQWILWCDRRKLDIRDKCKWLVCRYLNDEWRMSCSARIPRIFVENRYAFCMNSKNCTESFTIATESLPIVFRWIIIRSMHESTSKINWFRFSDELDWLSIRRKPTQNEETFNEIASPKSILWLIVVSAMIACYKWTAPYALCLAYSNLCRMKIAWDKSHSALFKVSYGRWVCSIYSQPPTVSILFSVTEFNGTDRHDSDCRINKYNRKFN